MGEQGLLAIKERVTVATEGPWKVGKQSPNGVQNVGTVQGLMTAQVLKEYDADFIAHARQDVPALIAEVERLQQELKEVTEYANYKNDLAMQNLRSLNEAHDEIGRLRKVIDELRVKKEGFKAATFAHKTTNGQLKVENQRLREERDEYRDKFAKVWNQYKDLLSEIEREVEGDKG